MRLAVCLLFTSVVAAITTPEASPGHAAQDQPQIAFVGERNGVNGVYLVNLDGTGERLVARETLAVMPASAWSPDGRSLAYLAARPEDEPVFAQQSRPFHFPLYLADVQTGATRRAADVPVRMTAWWSPDGRSLLFDSEHEGAPRSSLAAIYRLDVATRQVTRLTEVGRIRDAQWSPDGRQIAYASAGEIVIANADGSAPRTIVSSPTNNLQPRWSPRGDVIAYVAAPRPSPAGGPSPDGAGVWVVNPDGSNPRRVAEGTAATCRWSPDGTRLLVLASGLRIVTVADGASVAVLPAAIEAEFAPDGVHVVARTREGLVVVNLQTGAQRSLGPAIGLAVR